MAAMALLVVAGTAQELLHLAGRVVSVKQVERRPGRRFVSEVVEIHGYDPDRDEYNYGFVFDCHKELV